MLNVSQAIKDKFQSDLCRKELRITIGSTVLTNSAIYKDGFKLTESVMDGTVEFVGCIASILEFKISTLALAKGNYKGQTVTAEVAVYLNDNSLSSYIPLFHGFVDECTKSADGYYQQFICYDRLAYLSDEPGYNMYKAAFNSSSVDLQTFRDAIVLDCGMDAVNSQVLPNDDIIFRKRKRNKDITAMALLRHIAQINGAFGILNRDNRFEFRQIDDSASPESVLYYRDLKYSDYVVKPVGDSSTTPPTGSITIRTNSQDAGVTVDWTNYSQYAGTDPGWSDESQDTYLVDDDDANVVVDTYVIEGNLISYKLKAAKKRVIGANILASLGHDAVFREHTVKCNGLPYVECCDKVLFTKADSSQIEFVVTKRVLEGVQDMTDTYSCTINSQDANNKTFVSNVNNSTNNLGGSPDEALGLIEKTITVNGTYSANDDGAEGYSQVTVDVSGGDLGGEEVEAIAVGNLDAWSCVGVNFGTAGTPTQVPCSIPSDPYVYTDVGYGGGYVYYIEPYTTNIYRLRINDLSGTPELYLQSDATPYIHRNLACYKTNNKVILEDFISGNTTELQNLYPAPLPIDLGNLLLAKEYFTGITENNDPKLYGMNATKVMDGDYYAGYPTGPDGSGFSLTQSYGNIFKRIYVGTSNNTAEIDTSGTYKFSLTDTSMLDASILLKDTSGNICKSDFSTSTTGYEEIKYQGNNLVTDYNGRAFQWNAEGSRLFANLGSHGLAVFRNASTVDVYSGITGIDSATCCMFKNYFWDGKRLWDLNNSYPTMVLTDDKDGGDMLGYIKVSVQNGSIGTAYILFT